MTEIEVRLECLKLAAASMGPCSNATNFILARAAAFVTFIRQEIEVPQQNSDRKGGPVGPVGPMPPNLRRGVK
jgi:hypothetical protein